MNMGKFSATDTTAHRGLRMYMVGLNEDHNMTCFTGLDFFDSVTKYVHCHKVKEMPQKDKVEVDMTFTDPWEYMEKDRESDRA